MGGEQLNGSLRTLLSQVQVEWTRI